MLTIAADNPARLSGVLPGTAPARPEINPPSN